MVTLTQLVFFRVLSDCVLHTCGFLKWAYSCHVWWECKLGSPANVDTKLYPDYYPSVFQPCSWRYDWHQVPESVFIGCHLTTFVTFHCTHIFAVQIVIYVHMY